MRRSVRFTLAIAAAIGAVVLSPRTAYAQRAATERTLTRLENDWAQAVIRRDSAAIARIVAPRWVYSDETGVMDRAAGIKSFTSGPDTVTEAGNDKLRIIDYGNTAVAIGELWMRGRGASGPFERRYRYTDTWMRLNGRWRCIASQDYLMPSEAR